MILDSETAAMIQVAQKEAPFAFLRQTGLMAMGDGVPLRPEVETWLRGRLEWIQAGLERCPGWFRKTLKRFDPTLRLRWDSYKEHWIIERLNPNTNFFHRIGTWDRPLGHGLIHALEKGDMWKTTTAEKVKQVEDAAERQRKINEQQQKDGYLAQIDKMTNRQVEDFVEVSRALEHGESLQFAGPDADFMNKVWEEKKKNPDLPDTAMNPGMKPGNYQRGES